MITDFVCYGDTDSVVGDSIIVTNLGEIKIEDLWDMSDEKEQYGDGKKYIGILPGLKALSYSIKHDRAEKKKINYIMKHKVRKKIYRIKHGNKYVDITEDHSIMIRRNNEIISVKPCDISKTDKIIVF